MTFEKPLDKKLKRFNTNISIMFYRWNFSFPISWFSFSFFKRHFELANEKTHFAICEYAGLRFEIEKKVDHAVITKKGLLDFRHFQSTRGIVELI